MSLLTTILKQLINALQSGSIYALVALGYSMLYGIIMLLNFAHGDIIMVGAYIVWLMMARFALNPIIALLEAIVGCTALGVVIEKAAYKPLRSSPRISLLITAIGISYFLENAAQLIFGANARVIPPFINAEPITVGAVSIPAEAAVTLAAAGIAMVLLNVLVKKTKMGKAMRAVSEDAGAAQLMGININNTISFTFAVGSALAGIGSVLYCCAYPKATPTMGSMLGLKAFVAAVLGGIGSIPGAMAGGFAIGIAEALVSSAGLSEWKDGVVFAILIIVLLVKPTGLMGRPMTEKV